jgi:hypothetical protein
LKKAEPMNKQAVVMALTLALSLPCHAYNAVGVGAFSCGKVVTDLRGTVEPLKYIIVSWFQGYISGRDAEMDARVGRAKPSLPDQDAIRVFVENYCGANPLDDGYRAAEALWNSIH